MSLSHLGSRPAPGFNLDQHQPVWSPRRLVTPSHPSTSTLARHVLFLIIHLSFLFYLTVMAWYGIHAAPELMAQIQFQTEPEVYNRFLDVMKEFKGQM